MEDKIPQHIIDNFKSTYGGEFPNINQLRLDDYDIIVPLLKKSNLLWYNTVVVYEENLPQYTALQEHYQYDKSGIDIYYCSGGNEFVGFNVFILSKLNKKDIVDFVLFNLKKTRKNGNNRN